jgi:hypothetical protein
MFSLLGVLLEYLGPDYRAFMADELFSELDVGIWRLLLGWRSISGVSIKHLVGMYSAVI